MRPADVIFDLDDTLIESFPQYVRMHQRIAEELGWWVPERADLVEYATTWEETLRGLWPDRSLDPFIDRYHEVADEYVYPAVPGAIEALHELRDHGHPLWIVTKRSSRRLAQRMGQAKLDPDLFEGIFALEHQPISKPDPRCFEPVWGAGAKRNGAVYIGDREDDRLAAHSAGLRFAAVLTGPEAHQGFPHGPADAVLESAAHVATWLRGSR